MGNGRKGTRDGLTGSASYQARARRKGSVLQCLGPTLRSQRPAMNLDALAGACQGEPNSSSNECGGAVAVARISAASIAQGGIGFRNSNISDAQPFVARLLAAELGDR